MTAALLRNELFHHLLATDPERTRTENARAGALALAFHLGIGLLLLQIPTAQQPAADQTVSIPMLIQPFQLPEHPQAAAQRGTGGSVASGPRALIVPTVVPDVLQPPTTNLRLSTDPTPINIDPADLARRTGVGSVVSPGGDGGAAGGGDFIVVQNAPRMLNANQIAGLLRREYPSLLLQSGIGGTVILHVLIDLDGSVTDARVSQGSGIGALDDAALRVSREMQFSPAQSRGRTVRVWAAIPVVFSARD